MINYGVPESAKTLGLDSGNYKEIVENIILMNSLRDESWLKSIIRSADEVFGEIPYFVTEYAKKLYDDIIFDENIFRAVNMNFNCYPNSSVFGAGLYGYLAKFYREHPEKIPAAPKPKGLASLVRKFNPFRKIEE